MTRGAPIFGAILWLAAWFVCPFGPDDAVPSLSHVLRAGWTHMRTGVLVGDLLASLSRVSLGLLAATAAVALCGLLVLLLPRLARVVLVPLEFARSVPPIALAPLLIGLLGIGNLPAVAVVAFGAFFPIYQAMRFGLANVNREHLEIAQCFGAGTMTKVLHIVLPSLLGSVLSGLKTGLGIGWFCVIAAEMLGASSGLGFRLQNLTLNLNSSGSWFYILVIGVIGRLMLAMAQWLQEVVCPWQQDEHLRL